MPSVAPVSTPIPSAIPAKPSLSDVDAFGLTHPGKVRAKNADHFLIASFHRAMRVHASSVPAAVTTLSGDSRGFLVLVADGMDSFAQTVDGSERAMSAVAGHLLDMGEISLQVDPDRAEEVIDRIQTAMLTAHRALLDMPSATGARGAAPTTLTMAFTVWPYAFIIHAGDSRLYRLRNGTLERCTTDQNMAQVMVETGALTRESADASRLSHILLSAVGAPRLDPQVEVLDIKRGDMSLLCTDGLTRHVTEEEIATRMRAGGSSESICRDLLALALDRGGSDNVTVLVVRLLG